MIDEWQGTLNDMRGVTETYWDEVAEVMKGTDEEILAFLKQYSQDFAEASEEQAELYVKEWKDALEEWRKAYKQVADEIKDYDYTPTYSSGSGGGGGGGSSGGGGSGSSGGGSGSSTKRYTGRASCQYKDRNGSWTTVTAQRTSTVSQSAANSAAKDAALSAAKSAAKASWRNAGLKENLLNAVLSGIDKGNYTRNLKNYLTGGIVDFTGPAWLDGTKTKPERVLSARQTELFEAMVHSLETMSTVRVPWFGGFKPDVQDGGNQYVIENISIQVDKLDDDADYEEIARKVGEAMMKGFSRTNAVGGIRKM